ncbi:MAG: hypothetical protein A2015_02640 [Spirochaetes bacterium GWF1_31_7]|nr:MAG: hypothetical protein A2Y30_10150 [Spirochaetes bacterium GWE1_32_154]OHD52172.1 MAG: hypothetical protein A2Y29_17020 [Spirochaetes bacterium GWE2_31_10]OHD53162.1 MAG: hypothetical protein A2015_02640 [Spirochaetes bacterium GWF1_31_7]HBD94219.1 glycosyltransferase [Spirochaetia bacterium]HBI39308.1 glycosyltransferase [Spirochaetia bacterium]
MNDCRINIGGVLFHNVTLLEAADCVEAQIKSYDGVSGGELLLVANQDILNKVAHYKDLSYNDLNSSFLTIPDGYSIIYGARYLGTPLKERVTGPDLMAHIIEISCVKQYTHFFLGAAEGVAEKMSENFTASYPGLVVKGFYSPPFGDFTADEDKKIIDMINKVKPDILWVSFGCPKQEWWIARNKHDIKVPVIAGVGAAFDFHSGNKKRAPVIIQKMRLEWMYRILQEPGRLWRRYFDGGFAYIKILIQQKKVNK